MPTELSRLVMALNVKYGFENIWKGKDFRSLRAVATKIEDKEALLEGTMSGFGRH
jgi:hypothetical protein